jgi:hypothetical protein
MSRGVMNNIGLGIQINTLHRTFTGTDSNFIALFSLYELLHNFNSLLKASEGSKCDAWAVNWYKEQLEAADRGKLFFNSEVKTHIKKWYMSQKKWKKILEEAKIEYNIMLKQKGVQETIESLLEKAKQIELNSKEWLC